MEKHEIFEFTVVLQLDTPNNLEEEKSTFQLTISKFCRHFKLKFPPHALFILPAPIIQVKTTLPP